MSAQKVTTSIFTVYEDDLCKMRAKEKADSLKNLADFTGSTFYQ